MLLTRMVEVSHARIVSETKFDVFDLACSVNKTQLLLLDPRNALERLVICNQDLLLAIPLPVAPCVDKHLLLAIDAHVNGKKHRLKIEYQINDLSL